MTASAACLEWSDMTETAFVLIVEDETAHGQAIADRVETVRAVQGDDVDATTALLLHLDDGSKGLLGGVASVALRVVGLDWGHGALLVLVKDRTENSDRLTPRYPAGGGRRPCTPLGDARVSDNSRTKMDEKLIEDLRQARAAAMDAARPAAVAAAHAAGRLTPRERIDALIDAGSFVEYGVLAEAEPDDPGDAPADGLVAGAGTIDGHSIVLASYDAAVHAGSQSDRNLHKLTRLLYLANTHRWPFVCFVDGAGARPNQKREGPAIATGARSRWDVLDGLACLGQVQGQAVWLVGVYDVHQVMRNEGLLLWRRLGGADVHVPVHLAAVAVDDLAAETLG